MADTGTDENMQDGSPNPSSSRPAGKEGSLKHRILSRPAGSGTTGGSGNGSGDDSLSVSSHSTPVPSPSSSHSSSRMDTTSPPKKRPRISDRNSNSSPNTPHSDLSKSTNSTPSASRSEASTPSRSPNPNRPDNLNPYQPHQFNRGSLIQLANGELKAIEAMSSEDFIQSAAASPNLKVEFSEIARVERHVMNGQEINVVHFRVGRGASEVAVEACEDHPFFVLSKGWASTSPAATQSRFGLRVSQLIAGDTCISLSYREPGAASSDGGLINGRLSERNVRAGDTATSHPNPAVDSRVFNLTGSDLASFRRWSAPEDDRFLDNLPK